MAYGFAAYLSDEKAMLYWSNHKKLRNAILYFVIVLNSLLVLGLSFSSTKTNRVDAMTYLSQYRDMKCFVVENSNHSSSVTFPRFYLNKIWPRQYDIRDYETASTLNEYITQSGDCRPQFVLFLEDKNLVHRITQFKKAYPNLKFETIINPSFLDEVMFKLNPVNTNQITIIFRIQ
jgi:hypothetical protein